MAGSSDWQQLFELWRQWQTAANSFGAAGASKHAPPNPLELLQSLFAPPSSPSPFAQGANFFQSPWANAAPFSFESWQKAFGQYFEPAANLSGGSAGQDFMAMFNEAFQAPLRSFTEAFNALPPFDFSGTNVAGMADMPSWLSHQLDDLPPLGLSREWMERWQALNEALTEAQSARTDLDRQLGSIFNEASNRFIASINSPDAEQDPITTLRALYDHWVDIAEVVYREHVMSEDYAKAFGANINATARVKQRFQTLCDDTLETLNLPNRRELDAIIERHAALEKKVRELEAQANDRDTVNFLVDEIEQVNERIQKLADDQRAAENRAATTPTATTAAFEEPTKKTNAGQDEPAKISKKKRKKTTAGGRKKTPKAASSGSGDEFDVARFLTKP